MAKNKFKKTLLGLGLTGVSIYGLASLALKFSLVPGFGGKKRSLDKSVGYKSPADVKIEQNQEKSQRPTRSLDHKSSR